ncbi:MAG: UDP-N-acetylmuramate dehydrogenase [Candidatus Omnitrophica bacterium]|nr:UDP-N-acetylmuramate dehydrogenase [Candidatus Omnitrophota bacterium]MCF7894549.1 UDP-N-acetylmuramate dehydrogenase [Candidatus Omnitrophota bacterium]
MSLKKLKPKKNINLRQLTTLEIGGRAEYFFVVRDNFELSKLLKEIGSQFYILGNGSNLLIKDGLIKKPVVKLIDKFELIKPKGNLLEVGSSTLLSFLVKYCINNCLGGIENLAGIPATVGGMLSSAASSFGVSIFNYLEMVEVMDKFGNINMIKKDKINYSYRRSGLEDKIIIKGFFKFSKNNKEIKKKIQNIIKKRITLQDFSFPSCGSVFKNPVSAVAGALIEQAGLKGKRKGDIKISDKHANFILNVGKGSYCQADYLIKQIKDLIYQREGIVLEEEVKRWN